MRIFASLGISSSSSLYNIKTFLGMYNIHGKKRSGCCNIDENRIEQCFAAHIVHSSYKQYLISKKRNGNFTPDSGSTILLTSVHNVGSKTLFNTSILLSSGLGVFCCVCTGQCMSLVIKDQTLTQVNCKYLPRRPGLVTFQQDWVSKYWKIKCTSRGRQGNQSC